jgi:hypothetical protein
MDWATQLNRIRRWIRDPIGNIFSEPFLRRLYNDEQQRIYSLLGVVSNIQAIRTHPAFQSGYTHDLEWVYSGHANGEVYQVGQYYDAGDYVYLHVWEAESLKGYGATTQESGDVYTQPWEAWMVTTAWFPPPIPMPDDFDEAVSIIYDRDQVDPETKRELIAGDDTTWKTRGGGPISYWRDAKENNWIRLYPIPTLTWQDSEEVSGDPDEAEYGSTVVDVDSNIVAIYKSTASEIASTLDSSLLPSFLQKYVEYGVAARALSANTDGRIDSLGDYWTMRRNAGWEVIKKYKRSKLSDRKIQLKTRDGSSGSDRPRLPRLPSTYPDYWT